MELIALFVNYPFGTRIQKVRLFVKRHYFSVFSINLLGILSTKVFEWGKGLAIVPGPFSLVLSHPETGQEE